MDEIIRKALENYQGNIIPLWNTDFAWAVNNALRSAQKTIYLTTYKMEPKKGKKAERSNRLISQLVSANNKGLDVKVLLNFQENKKATSSINWYAATALKNRGLSSHYVISGRILHAKIILIDADVVIIGSHNWSVMSHDRNIEFSVFIKSVELNADMRKWFLGLWENSNPFPVKKT